MSDCFLPITNKLGLEEGFLSELTELHVPMEVTRSFSAALLTACHAIQAGVYNTVLVGGIEKMTDRWDKIRDDLMLLDDPWSYYAGGTPESNHELLMRAYIKKHHLDGEGQEKLNLALAQISVKNHCNAVNNKYAQFKKAITVDQVLKTRKEAHKPLGMLDFAPISDGASAIILTSGTAAKKLNAEPVYILGCGSATDYLNYPAREDLSHFLAAKLAMKTATQAAKTDLSEVQVVEVYDQSTMMELVSLEDLGFFRTWNSLENQSMMTLKTIKSILKQMANNSSLILMVDSKLTAIHLAQQGGSIYEIYNQIKGTAAERQVRVDGALPKKGCVLEFEGFGTKAYATILGEKTN